MLESNDSNLNNEVRHTASPVLPIALAGDSPILEELLKACLAESPWIQLRDNVLMINWQHALEHRAKANGALQGEPNQRVLEVLDKLIPTIDFSTIAELGQFYSARPRNTVLQAKIRVSELQVSHEFNTLARLIQELLDQISQVADIDSLRQDLRAYVKLFTDFEFGKYYKYEYDIAARFVVARGDMISLLKGRAQSNINIYSYYARSEPQNHKHSWALTRRLIRYKLDIFTLFDEHMSLGTKQTEDLKLFDDFYKNVIERFMHLGTLERRLTRLVNTPSYNVKDSKHRCLFIRRNFCGGGRGYDLNNSELVDKEYSEVQYMLSNLTYSLYTKYYSTNILNHKKLGKLLAEIDRSSIRADKSFRLLHDEVSEISNDEDGHLCKEIEDNIDWLFSDNPIFILFTSGFLSANQPRNHATKATICLSPWLASAIVAKKTLNLEPFSYLGPDSCDLREETEEPEQSKNKKMGTDLSARLGADVWRNFY